MAIDRIDLYLQQSGESSYTNSKEEQALVLKFSMLYDMAKNARDSNELANPKNIAKWRKAYYGTLNALDKNGNESLRKSKQLRKLVYEMVESKIDNNIPLPQMKARYKSDTFIVECTENYLKHEIDTVFTKYLNDKSERATYVDGTVWYKVWWDSLDNKHERSGNVKIDICLADQIVPQPGVLDYRKLEYIFEVQQMSISRIYDLYGRLVTSSLTDSSKDAVGDELADTSTVTVVTCYYLNSRRIVGKFAWAAHSMQVICNEEDWQIRKLRTCSKCFTVVPQAETCHVCGSTNFNYKVAENEVLPVDLQMIYNPYDAGETDDIEERDRYVAKDFLTEGTELPYYIVRQLPFVPRPAISSIESIYGISEPFILMDIQDSTNKMLTKVEDKILKSGTVVTKPHNVKIDNSDETFKIVNIKATDQAAMIQNIEVKAEVHQDIISSQLLYDSAKASSGVTDSFQGKKDTTATSGRAKEVSALQTAGRIESLRVMKAAAFAGVYELVLKYLLAFSDEKRRFVKTLPDGTETEEEWSKYLFLAKDDNGMVYYRDDFTFDSDPAATLSQNRVGMWQETQDKFITGALGNPAEPATIELFWNLLGQQQYPLAKLVLAGIKENSQRLPAEMERLLAENPELLQQVLAMAGMGDDGHGGARPGAGAPSSGVAHAAQVEKTNERNRSLAREQAAAIEAGSMEE